MTWTYTEDFGTDPAGMRNRVRVRIGDTDAADPQISDEAIAYFLADGGSVLAAAAQAARSLQARYARQADKTVGNLRISLSDKARAYKDLAQEIEAEAEAAGVVTPGRRPIPWAGGISVGEKRAAETLLDRPPSYFRPGMHDYPGSDPRAGR